MTTQEQEQQRTELRRLLEAEISALPWHECGFARGGCVCGMIWSRSEDIHVATAHNKHEDMPGPGPERQRANAKLIVAACNAAGPLLDLADDLEQQIRELRQDHGLKVHGMTQKYEAAVSVVQDFKERVSRRDQEIERLVKEADRLEKERDGLLAASKAVLATFDPSDLTGDSGGCPHVRLKAAVEAVNQSPNRGVEPLDESEKTQARQFGANDAVRSYCRRIMSGSPGLRELEEVGFNLVNEYFREIGHLARDERLTGGEG